jgi:hypothetical protein
VSYLLLLIFATGCCEELGRLLVAGSAAVQRFVLPEIDLPDFDLKKQRFS